jgi:hypothetical protein
MINVNYLTSGRALNSEFYIKKNKEIECEIQKRSENKSIERKLKYLKLSNALKELIKEV